MKINFSLPAYSFLKENIKYILIVVILYLFFLILNIPAAVILTTISLPDGMTLSSLSGTVWSGNAKEVKYAGIDLGSAHWELHPVNLLVGELSADVSIENKEQYIKTEVNFSSSGKIELEETRFLIDLSSLQPLTYGMPLSYAGKASGYFPISFFHKNNYIGLNGELSLSDIEMISPQQQSFGDFHINFQAENDGATSGRIKDSAGLLKIDGRLTLNKDGKFNYSAKLAAREKDSPLEKVISFLGRKDASGYIQLNSNYKLWH